MAIKLKISRKSLFIRMLLNPWGKAAIVAFLVVTITGLSVFSYYYVKYARLTEAKLKAGPFANTSMLFAKPQPVMIGEEGSSAEIANYLRRCGYGESNTNRAGWYQLRADAIDIYPGPDAYDSEGAVVKFAAGKVNQIISLRDHTERTQYLLEPEMITNLFDRKREKRRLVHFQAIPKVMVNAVLAAEDKRFFMHAGFDPIGIMRAALIDIRDRSQGHGASTLSQQLARTLWLGAERGWQRKLPEMFITLHLEQKLTKEQIFENYANAIYLGHVGSFSIHGFGEGAQVFLGKDLSRITLPEAALLAGLIHSPASRNPFKYPDRAKARRDWVLGQMRENGYITQKEYEAASAAELKVTREETESSDAPYFVDLVNDNLQARFQDHDFQNNSYRVYTTLDLDLQRDAVQAVKMGMAEVDAQWKRRNKGYGTQMPEAQVALVALDTQTGEVRALVGGRNYGTSQLDRAIAKRQPGSAFKPFVYTAALSAALEPGGAILTPATTVVDEPTTFWYENNSRAYEPNNFKDEYKGTVTLRYALSKSLNIPAVKVAEMAGYDRIVRISRAAGLNVDIKPTPSIALGSYEVTPLEIAGAYTIFPNRGEWIKPAYVKTIRNGSGTAVFEHNVERKPVIDPRVAYLMTNMMEEVMRSGTAAGVRSRGFLLPAAGKTGTSHDGWFAGFTSRLICVVWVGFDDNRDFRLEGARSALPIWTEFMKRAHSHREYRGVRPFSAPDGVVIAEIDPLSGQLATASCLEPKNEVFISGTQPVETCRLHGGGRTMIAGWEPAEPPRANVEAPPVVASIPRENREVKSIPVKPKPAPAEEKQKERKGFFSRFRDLFKK